MQYRGMWLPHLSCTSFCNCSGGETCCNPYTTQEDAQSASEEDVAEDVDMVDAEEEDFEEEGSYNTISNRCIRILTFDLTFNT